MNEHLRILNHHEELTFNALSKVIGQYDAHVFPKVRLADVFKIDRSGVSSEHFSYSLKSHFDFVIADSDYQPKFSVEFDGPLHSTSSVQRKRDALKDELCKHFNYSLLRINSRYLSPDYRGIDLLGYFVDAWFLEKGFIEAQEKGQIPYDESFDLTFIYSNGGEKKWPYWLSVDAQRDIQKHHSSGKIGQATPSFFVGTDSHGNFRGISWVVIDKKSVVFAKTGMRAQNFPAVCKSDLVSMLCILDLNKSIEEALGGSGKNVLELHHFFSEYLPNFQNPLTMMCSASTSPTI